MLISACADKNAKDEDHWTPLHMACSSGQLEVARLLLAAGADKDPVDKHCERTPLHVAAWSGDSAAVKLLLNAGANREARDKEGRTPLLVAIDQKHVELVRILIQAGADVSVQDKAGRSVLHTAAERGMLDVVKIVLGGGAWQERELSTGTYRNRLRLHPGRAPNQGGCAKVILAFDTLPSVNQLVTIKFFYEKDRRDLIVSILRMLGPDAAPYVAMLAGEEAFDDHENYLLNPPYAMVQQTAEASLQEVIAKQDKPGGLPAKEAKAVLKQVADAICFLHLHNITLHDLTTNSIGLFADGRYRLVGFDHAAMALRDRWSGITLEVCPPEIASAMLLMRRGEPLPADMRRARTSTDMWCLGCVLYHIITGRPAINDLFPDFVRDNSFAHERVQDQLLEKLQGLSQEHMDNVVMRNLGVDKLLNRQAAQLLCDGLLKVDRHLRCFARDLHAFAYLK